MPILVDPDATTVARLLEALPPGAQGAGSHDRLHAWLDQHLDEYVVVLGPHVPLGEAVATCEGLRTTHPAVSVVLVRDALDTQVLAQAMKAGARDVVPLDDPASMSAAVERARQLHEALRGSGGGRQPGQVVTVFSPKGGVGKTTTAVNLALALADRGARRVCLVDLDLAFGDVAITLQLFPTHSIEHAIGSEDSLDAAMLDGLMTRHPDSLAVLAAPSHPDARERISAQLVSRVLGTLRQEYDFVVVDTAPAFDEQTLSALDETDECVLVATLDVPTLKNVKVALETLDMLAIAPGHRHLLLNRADDQVGIGPDKVESILGLPVSGQIATSLEIAAATNAGVPIVLEKPDHQSSRELRALAGRFTGEPDAPVPAAAAAASSSSPASRPGRRRADVAPQRPARRFKLRR